MGKFLETNFKRMIELAQKCEMTMTQFKRLIFRRFEKGIGKEKGEGK